MISLESALFFLVRHGNTKGNIEKIYRAWSNAPKAQLDATGRRASAEAGEYLKKMGAPVELIIADSLDRVQETAEIIAAVLGGVRVETVRALHPLDMGDWTLQSKEKHPVEPFFKDTKKQIPGGETIDGFNARQRAIWTSILNLAEGMPGGRLVVVVHGSNVSYLYNHMFNKGEPRVDYEGLVDPGGVLAATTDGLVPLTRVREKERAERKGGGEPMPVVQFRPFDILAQKQFYADGTPVLQGGTFPLQKVEFEAKKLELPGSYGEQYHLVPEDGKYLLDIREVSYPL